MIPDLRRDTGSLSGNRDIGNVRVFLMQSAVSDPFVDEGSGICCEVHEVFLSQRAMSNRIPESGCEPPEERI